MSDGCECGDTGIVIKNCIIRRCVECRHFPSDKAAAAYVEELVDDHFSDEDGDDDEGFDDDDDEDEDEFGNSEEDVCAQCDGKLGEVWFCKRDDAFCSNACLLAGPREPSDDEIIEGLAPYVTDDKTKKKEPSR
jgi:hypothetical protein